MTKTINDSWDAWHKELDRAIEKNDIELVQGLLEDGQKRTDYMTEKMDGFRAACEAVLSPPKCECPCHSCECKDCVV